MIGKFFNKGRPFLKTKLVYLTLAGFLRKLLLYTMISDLDLYIKGIPIYLPELLNTLHLPTITPYKHPFNEEWVDEVGVKSHFLFNYFIFLNTKSYSFMKTRGRGRVKRKIRKRLVKLNHLID